VEKKPDNLKGGKGEKAHPKETRGRNADREEGQLDLVRERSGIKLEWKEKVQQPGGKKRRPSGS